MTKQIENYPNYTITEEGIITNIKTNKILKHTLSSQGYLEIQLWNNGKGSTLSVHRLVAIHFITNPNKELYNTVHHKDDDRQNCHYSNLEWTTNQNNIYYKNNKKYKGKLSKTRLIKLYKSKKWSSVEEFLIEIIKQ